MQQNLLAAFQKRAVLCMALLIGGITCLLYQVADRCEFLTLDDILYVQNNPYLAQGFTAESLWWMCTSHLTDFSPYSEYWSPLTLATRLLDATFYGPNNAGGFHLTSVLLHALNTLVLFCALRALTGAPGKSALVALVFLVHPQHAEPVMWLSARKDLVSALFFFLTLWAYAHWAREKSRRHTVLLWAAFLGGCMAKPMTVSTPCVLLILDCWPLGRFQPDRATLRRLVWEKIPFFVLALGVAALAMIGQRRWGAMQDTEAYPMAMRIANACLAYGTYIRRIFYPVDLAIYYPHPGNSLSYAAATGACLFLSLLAVFAWRGRSTAPWCLAGYAWFLVVLGPVIGIVQLANQAMADRYAYPSVPGLLIALVWQADLLVHRFPSLRRWAIATGVLFLGALGVWTSRYAATWQNSTLVFEHALRVTKNNAVAHSNLGGLHQREGAFALALPHFRAAADIRPGDTLNLNNYGACASAVGDVPTAINLYERSIARNANQPRIHWRLAALQQQSRNAGRAEFHYRECIRQDGNLIGPVIDLSKLLLSLGRKADAAVTIAEGLKRWPDHEALLQLQRSIVSTPNSSEW